MLRIRQDKEGTTPTWCPSIVPRTRPVNRQAVPIGVLYCALHTVGPIPLSPNRERNGFSEFAYENDRLYNRSRSKLAALDRRPGSWKCSNNIFLIWPSLMALPAFTRYEEGWTSFENILNSDFRSSSSPTSCARVATTSGLAWRSSCLAINASTRFCSLRSTCTLGSLDSP